MAPFWIGQWHRIFISHLISGLLCAFYDHLSILSASLASLLASLLWFFIYFSSFSPLFNMLRLDSVFALDFVALRVGFHFYSSLLVLFRVFGQFARVSIPFALIFDISPPASVIFTQNQSPKIDAFGAADPMVDWFIQCDSFAADYWLKFEWFPSWLYVKASGASAASPIVEWWIIPPSMADE